MSKFYIDSLPIKNVPIGHYGTHIDKMGYDISKLKKYYEPVFFNVIGKNLIDIKDIDLNLLDNKDCVVFITSYSNKVSYGSEEYRKNHPELSDELIDELLKNNIKLIAIDFGGLKRGKLHNEVDEKCASNGCFIIENLINLKEATLLINPVLEIEIDISICSSGCPCKVFIKEK